MQDASKGKMSCFDEMGFILGLSSSFLLSFHHFIISSGRGVKVCFIILKAYVLGDVLVM